MGVPPKGTPKYKKWLEPKKTNKHVGKTNKQPKCVKVSDAPLDKGLVFFCICGFPEGCLGFLKTLGTTKQPNKTKPISKGASETFNNIVFVVFSRRLFWFSLVFFGIVGFPEGFRGFLKTFGKTNKPNKTKPISKGGSETSKHFGCSVLPNVFLVFFGLLCYCWLSDQSNEQHCY